jgi:hypothetical protein
MEMRVLVFGPDLFNAITCRGLLEALSNLPDTGFDVADFAIIENCLEVLPDIGEIMAC